MKSKVDKSPQHMCMPMEDHGCNNMLLAHSYVPWQCYNTAFCPQEALMKGTLFPELYGVYTPPK